MRGIIPSVALISCLCFVQLIHAQTKVDMSKFSSASYTKEWSEVDSFESKGLPKSALEQVTIILDKSQKENNPAQLTKALIYKAKYLEELEEDGMIAAINMLEEALKQATFPTQSILHSLLGELYQNYLEGNYWRIRNRTEVDLDTLNTSAISLWGIAQFVKASSTHFLASLAEKDQLIALPTQFFDPIILKGEESQGLRPTCYDLLAHRAIDHFMNDRTYLSEPREAFVMDDPALFSPVASFVDHTFTTADAMAYKYQALQIMQEVLAVHQGNKDLRALIDVDLKRLKFVYAQAVLENKDERYLEALKALVEKYDKHASYGEIAYAMASFYENQGRNYRAGTAEEYQWDLKKAHSLCEEIIRREKDSYAAKQAKYLKGSIEAKNIDGKGEKVYLPNQAGLMRIDYKNTDRVYLKVVKVFEEDGTDDFNKHVKQLTKAKAFKSWSYDLPNLGDFQAHSVEVAIPELPFGRYAVVIGDNRQFDIDKGNVDILLTQVSSLAYFYRGSEGGQFLVMDRQDGQPLAGVKVSLWAYEYNRQKQSPDRKFLSEVMSDEQGMAKAKLKINGNYFVKLEKGKDALFLDDQNYYNYVSSDPFSEEARDKKNLFTHFFLDRGIYRPGQTIYFKGLVMEDKKGSLMVASNEEVTIKLIDVNGEEVSKIVLKTNEYGTVNGRFQAPQSGLLGQMAIASSAGENQQFFSVEEYKRPKFEASFKPIEKAFSLGDEVKVTGTAEGFAGNMIDGATVAYRVVREVNYPWIPWWYWGKGLPRQGVTQEIAFGETSTNEKGEFEFTFVANPDLSIAKENNPAFIFKIYADVIDITGETHSAEKQLKLAYLGYQASLTLAASADRQKAYSLAIKTENLDGQFQAASGTLQIFPLTGPDHPTLDRYWEVPDQFVLKEKEFNSLFPWYTYRQPKQQNEWPRGKAVFEQNLNTGETTTLSLAVSDWPVGHFLAVFTMKDDNGNEIISAQPFYLYDQDKAQLPKNIHLWQQFNQETFQPGEELRLQLATGGNPMHVFVEREKGPEVKTQQWVNLDKWQNVNYTIEETDRGNIQYKGTSVFQNRIFTFEQTILVPWTNKELEIEYQTFRDKLLPGQEEEWKIVVKGPKKEAVVAEVVAAMYDASLDQFVSNDWSFFPYHYSFFGTVNWFPGGFGSNYSRNVYAPRPTPYQVPTRNYERLNWFDWLYSSVAFNSAVSPRSANMPIAYSTVSRFSDEDADEAAMSMKSAVPPPPPPPLPETTYDTFDTIADVPAGSGATSQAPPIRTNLNETVFFMPDLQTDEAGNVVIKFKMNEALTKWKFQLFAHTKALELATSTKEVLTQKELMVLPNAPRFMRETDEIVYTAKVTNLSAADMQGKAKLALFNAADRAPVDAAFGNKTLEKDFAVKAGQSSLLSWTLQVPKGEVAALVHQVTAQAGAYSDGEESILPVLTNRMLVTEALPLPLRANETKTFTLNSLNESASSPSLTHQSLSLEFTTNPAWYAVQSLPYMMEYPHECTEQIFNRFYANTLATGIVNQRPAIKTMFSQWASAEALGSDLAKNEDLKSVLLEETPWVFDAQSEAQQRKNIALLFDLSKMEDERNKVAKQLAERQSANGGFSWFPGGQDSWYITQYLLEGIGHLEQLKVLEVERDQYLSEITIKGIQYIDQSFNEFYKDLKIKAQNEAMDLKEDHLSSIVIHYLYTRSMFGRTDESGGQEEAVGYFLEQAKQYWLNRGLYQQGLLALALHRYGDHTAAMDIIRSLEERAIKNDELGMYWKYNRGWFWHELPIETHVLLLEAFAEVAGDMAAVDEMKIWLLKQKQTTNWKTTKATAAAVYGLLAYGQNWLTESEDMKITFPKLNKKAYQEQIKTAQDAKVAGIGYYKTTFDKAAISADYATVKVKNPNNQIVWGGLYWQYFEDLDAIKTFEDTPLQLKKQLFLEERTDKGLVLSPIDADHPLVPGDKLKVRIELKVDRDMEYIHMKDMRASGLEPINVLSSYKWQGGLGYYESTKDAATHFFFDFLPKGAYVFEYPLRVVHEGKFSNGITSIQSMYAPEFTSHSEGVKIEVKR
ncbi:MAG: alpha-2-macroglobulin family protein [Saprospiraceae bacterium]